MCPWIAKNNGAWFVLQWPGPTGELGTDTLFDEADLRVARVLVLGEAESKQALADEAGGWPSEGCDLRRGARRDISGHRPLVTFGRPRSVERHISERPRVFNSEADPLLCRRSLECEFCVSPIDVEKVLALDVEHECSGEWRGPAKHCATCLCLE